jgi:V-type H+-transporting ATPase subunit C
MESSSNLQTTSYWVVSLPLSEGDQSRNGQTIQERKDIAFQRLEAKTRGKENGELCESENRKLFVPELKIGTLDSLLALSDDLQKINGQIENVTQKIKRQIQEIGEHIAKESMRQRRDDNNENNNNNSNEAFAPQVILTVDGVPTEQYLAEFKWDEAKNPAKRQLRETVEKITENVAKIDDELKMKLGEYVMAKNSLSTVVRKTQGSLATRDLGDLVREEDMIETENLTTLLVTIPKFSAQDWLDSYETLAQFVVPRSSKMLKEESDYALFTVTLFRRTVDSFKNAVREKNGSFQVREYSYNKEKITENKEEKQSLEEEVERQRIELYEWCQTSYGEVVSSWIHVVVVRLFVESILRYGLPPAFQAVIMRPKERQEKKLRSVMNAAFGNGSSSHWSATESGGGSGGGDAGGFGGERGGDDCFPYVSFTVTL